MGLKRKRVIAAIRLGYSSCREVISGIFNRMDSGLDWDFEFALSENSLREQISKAQRNEGADGFIISSYFEKDIIENLITLDKPVVFCAIPFNRPINRKAPTVMIRNDGQAIGRLAADYLDHLGKFASRAYVHVNKHRANGYSDERLSGIAKAEVFESPFLEETDEDTAALGEFLVNLPKPAAVIAANDKRALDVMAVAHKLGIKIPNELSVVGVDNDEMLCSHCDPPLTSVQPGHYEMGYRAADELNRLLAASVPPKNVKIIKIPPKRVAERESTRATPPAEELVRRANEFINANACNGIGPVDVATHLRCSRSLIDLRYRERTGITVRQAIENRRMKEVQRLLKTTKRPLKTIAEQCGYNSESWLCHLFTQRFGISPSEWRKARR